MDKHKTFGKKQYLVLFIVAALILSAFTGCTTQKQIETESTNNKSTTEPLTTSETVPTTEKGSVIVIYFSRTGHTKPLAEYIKDELEADIFEIEAKIPYTDDDIKYYTDCRADREQKDPSARPEIAGDLPDLSKYDTIYIGYPIWHGQAPKIIYTFLESVNVSGKTLIPFCTSASSPVGSSAENLHPLAQNAVWKDGTRFAIGTSREEIKEWLNSMNTQCELKLYIGENELSVNWMNNSSVEALKELAKGGITIQMSMYGGFEQVGPLNATLPTDDKQTTTDYGDIVLYSGNQIVIFYGSNSWSYTRLGHINLSRYEMIDLLSNGDVNITLRCE
ncbi:MAG: hypothetical protein K6F14_00870 [Clostridiales bacterium]|nr:hypothetical protein [Clostridiales bacterium]